MGSAEGLMGYWLRGHEGDRNKSFSKIQLVDQKCREKTTAIILVFKAGPFHNSVGYNI